MKVRTNFNSRLLVLVLFLLGMVCTAEGQTVFVDANANGANDGSSWANAYTCLQDALADANSNPDVNEIRVAQAIYKPDEGVGIMAGDREATFQLINGVALYGGYAGCGQPDPNARDPNTYETILSGDLDGNDVDLNEPSDLHHDSTRAENSYTVVTGSGVDSTAVLDGFTIRAGHANDLEAEVNSPANNGGGMYNRSGNPTVADCTFLRNTAKVIWSSVRIAGGGGMFNLNSSPTLRNCRFIENVTFNGEVTNAGGGMFNINSGPILVDCVFRGNVVTGFDDEYIGGGMCNYGSNPSLANCSFIANQANTRGGGMFNDYNSSPTLTGCTFRDNWAHYVGGGMFNERSTLILTDCIFGENISGYSGGGIHNEWDCLVTITNCAFSGNSAGRWAGGVHNFFGCSVTLSSCTFTGNRAGRGGGVPNAGHAGSGGGVYNYSGSSVTLSNCTLAGNRSGRGGGMYNADDSDTTLANCTFSGNVASDEGGGVYNYYCNPVLNNCILWGDAPTEIHLNSSTPLITYSNVQGGWPGDGNIDADPCFVELGYWDATGVWVDGDYHLLPDSPCIDAGDNESVPADVADLDGDGNTAEPIPWDLDGNPRVVDGNNGGNSVVDMGAYEFFIPPIELPMKFTPQTLNCCSEGKWVKAHFVLPEESSVEDVDADTPATLKFLGIEIYSEYVNVFINEDSLVEVEIAFDRAAFCGAVTDNVPTEIAVVVEGFLTSGKRFVGEDTVNMACNNLKWVADFASHWLQRDCGPPGWCSGFDLNQDSVVNFLDFAMADELLY